jgi:hypothetical protein
MSEPNPYAAPKAEVRDIDAHIGSADIAALAVSDRWKVKFRLLEKAGGVKLTKFKDLSMSERMKVNFNLLGFLFGPIYYLCKGMWKKGLALFGACLLAVVALVILLDLAGLGRFANALGYGAAAMFGVRANIDYYKKMVLGQNGWW